MPSAPPKHGRAKRRKSDNAKVAKRQRKRWLATSSTKWIRIAQCYLTINPLCVECDKTNIITPATEVDHINGRADRSSDYVDSNYQSLCKPCHSRKTFESYR